EEACGTSGMKAGINGALNLSILDGWFDEGGEDGGGWAIGDREPYSAERDDVHAAGLYNLLESEIVPLFFEDREQSVPVEWIRRVKRSIEYLSLHFNCQRMVGEYNSRQYDPAHRGWMEMQRENFSLSRTRVAWNGRIASAWPDVEFRQFHFGPGAAVN